MSITRDFLAHVLPREGEYCCFVIETKRHFFVRGIDDLSRCILQTDERGETVYHAIASFSGRRRKGNNVRALRCFPVDIDTKITHPDAIYVDQQEACNAVLAFVERTAFPMPLFVNSGGGVNLYWTVDVELDRATWLTYARGLKLLLHREGLATDPSRTSDAASVLRTPGTHNRKGGIIRPVRVGPFTGPYSLSLFERLLHEKTNKAEARPDGSADALTNAVGNIYAGDYPERYADSVANGCPQIRLFRETHGNIPEPTWHAGVGVLVFCSDGPDKIHEWSSGYPDYTPEETQERIDRTKKLSGATTCKRFHDLNPAVCEACPHWQKINSPISLGRQEPAGTNAIVKQLEGQLPALPPSFYWKNNALITSHENARGGSVDVVVSDYPVYLCDIQTGETRGDWNYVFRQFLPAKGWFDFTVPASVLFSSHGGSEIHRWGANIHELAHFLRYCRGAISMHHRSKGISTHYDQFGWKEEDSSFLYGLTLYTPSGPVTVNGNNDLRVRCQKNFMGPHARGSLKEWIRLVNYLFAPGCESQTAAVLASFGAPAMKFMDPTEGGAVMHLVTWHGGTGKSTSHIGSASVWGHPKEGLGLGTLDTQNSKGKALSILCNLPVYNDELTIKDPYTVRDFIVMFTDGRERRALTRNGELRNGASGWQTMLISAANTSLVDKMHGMSDGPTSRIMEFSSQLPPEIDKSFGDKLKRELLANSGHAGAFYMEHLVKPQNLAMVREVLDKVHSEVYRDLNLGTRGRFWCRSITAMLVCGTFAKNLGLLPELDIGRIREWLYRQSSACRNIQPNKPDIDVFAEFIDKHRDCILIVAGPWHRHNPPTVRKEPLRTCLIRYEEQNHRYFFNQSALRDWMIKNEYSYRELVDIGQKEKLILNPNTKITLSKGSEAQGGQTWCLELDAAHPSMGNLIIETDEKVVRLPNRLDNKIGR